MQTKEFDYDSVPQGFAHCLNEQCPQSADCLRRKAALHIPTDCQEWRICTITFHTMQLLPSNGVYCIISAEAAIIVFIAKNPFLTRKIRHLSARHSADTA